MNWLLDKYLTKLIRIGLKLTQDSCKEGKEKVVQELP